MRKLLGFMILCIPLYAWGSESFSVSLSLHEHARYAMNTSYEDSCSPTISTYRSPNAIGYFLEGVGGIVGGVVCFVVPVYVACIAFPEGDIFPDGLDYGIRIGMPASVLLGVPGGVSITGKLLGHKGSYRMSLLGTLVGCAAGAGFVVLTTTDFPISFASAAFPICGAVWGYHWGKDKKKGDTK